MNKSLFGVGSEVGILEILFVLALLISHAFTSAGDGTVDWRLRYLAATPATWGEAIDVPEMVLIPPSSHVDVIFTPGAII